MLIVVVEGRFFFKYLDDWKRYTETREDLTAIERNKMMLSRKTLEGIHMTGKSFMCGMYTVCTMYVCSYMVCMYVYIYVDMVCMYVFCIYTIVLCSKFLC